jgi:translation initiation factor 5B
VGKIKVVTDNIGVILKTDTLGSLEAIISELEKNGVPIRLADIGDVSKREVIEASLIKKSAPLRGVVLTFDVKVLPDAKYEAESLGVPIFQSNVVYHLIDEYQSWVEKEQKATTKKELESLVLPGEIRVLPNYVFRKSKPVVFGVEVLKGRIRQKYSLLGVNGTTLGEIMQIQDKGESITEATIGMKVAVSMKEPIIGRDFNEGDILYVAIPESHLKKLFTTYQQELSSDDMETLKELIDIMKKKNPIWGI